MAWAQMTGSWGTWGWPACRYKRNNYGRGQCKEGDHEPDGMIARRPLCWLSACMIHHAAFPPHHWPKVLHVLCSLLPYCAIPTLHITEQLLKPGIFFTGESEIERGRGTLSRRAISG
jgi:hypothetical protein